MYCTYRSWIQTEIEAAKRFGKPAIAIRPLGQERLPGVICEADEQVGWRTASIITAIRWLATASGGCADALTRGALANQSVLAPSSPTAYANLASLTATPAELTLSSLPPNQQTGRYRCLRPPENSLQNALEAAGMFTIPKRSTSSSSTSLLESLANYRPPSSEVPNFNQTFSNLAALVDLDKIRRK